jgi:hypothetical protein
MGEQGDFERVRRYRDVGGTSGGLGEFVVGFALLVLGGYLLLSRVVVTSGAGGLFGWTFFGHMSFGVTLIPLFLGVALLFFDGRSVVGWLLTAAGALLIFGAILADMHLYFRPTSLVETLIVMLMIAAGLGLIIRSLREHRPREN